MANTKTTQPNFFMDQIDKNWFAIVIMFCTFLIGYAVFKNDFQYLRNDVDSLKDGNVISKESEDSIKNRLTAIETEQKGFNSNQSEMVNALKDLTKEVNALKVALAKSGVTISQAPNVQASTSTQQEDRKPVEADKPNPRPTPQTPERTRPKDVILTLVSRLLGDLKLTR